MGRDKAEKGKGKLSPFVALDWTILNSKAYKDLSGNPAKALPYFLGRPKVPSYDLHYLKSVFAFSYPEAKKLNFARGTWYRVLCDLVHNGFLDPVTKGGLKGYGKASSQFRLSDRWKKYGHPDFVYIDLKTWGT